MVTLLLKWLAMLPVMMLGMMWVLLRSMMLIPVFVRTSLPLWFPSIFVVFPTRHASIA
jgi:hypothetical protein